MSIARRRPLARSPAVVRSFARRRSPAAAHVNNKQLQPAEIVLMASAVSTLTGSIILGTVRRLLRGGAPAGALKRVFIYMA